MAELSLIAGISRQAAQILPEDHVKLLDYRAIKEIPEEIKMKAKVKTQGLRSPSSKLTGFTRPEGVSKRRSLKSPLDGTRKPKARMGTLLDRLRNEVVSFLTSTCTWRMRMILLSDFCPLRLGHGLWYSHCLSFKMFHPSVLTLGWSYYV